MSERYKQFDSDKKVHIQNVNKDNLSESIIVLYYYYIDI